MLRLLIFINTTSQQSSLPWNDKRWYWRFLSAIQLHSLGEQKGISHWCTLYLCMWKQCIPSRACPWGKLPWPSCPVYEGKTSPCWWHCACWICCQLHDKAVFFRRWLAAAFCFLIGYLLREKVCWTWAQQGRRTDVSAVLFQGLKKNLVTMDNMFGMGDLVDWDRLSWSIGPHYLCSFLQRFDDEVGQKASFIYHVHVSKFVANSGKRVKFHFKEGICICASGRKRMRPLLIQ